MPQLQDFSEREKLYTQAQRETEHLSLCKRVYPSKKGPVILSAATDPM